MKRTLILSLIVGVVLLLPAISFAQASTTACRAPVITPVPLKFNGHMREQVQGRILSMEWLWTCESPCPYVVAVVRPEDDTPVPFRVILAPMPVLLKLGIAPLPGRWIQANGSRVTMNHSRHLIAVQVGQGISLVDLRRFENGAPLFALQPARYR